ncbi:type II methionyl aminopeptidase [Candidatus Woesearchaeota archaeon]|nr:type II methionyl aminopeptidase [Candidatus Woesearchaeota archaeon]
MENWVKAGKIAAESREYAASLIKPNISLLEISEKVEKFIKDKGAEEGFPSPQLSINNIAAHYIAFPNDKTIIQKGDVVKVDIGIHFEGCVGDNATTVEAGTNKFSKLIEATHKARDNAIKEVKEGIQVCKIGEAIEETAKSYGFKVITNLSGHNLKPYIIHGGITIPNYNNGDKTKLKNNEVIAIEPFLIENGSGLIKEGKSSSIYRLDSNRIPRDIFQRQLIQYIITKYQTLPFSTRQLAKVFPLSRLQIALALLKRQRIISEYAQLPEQSGAIVAQAENTIIVKQDHAEITTKI